MATLKQKGFRIFILTNSPEFRLKKFTEYYGIEGVSWALKPHTFKLKKLIKKYNYKPSEVALIGDQIMTDVKCGNKVGVTTILTKPLHEEEFFVTKINRFLENKKLKELEKKGLFHKDDFYE